MEALHGLEVTLVANQYLHFVVLVVYLCLVCRDLFCCLGTCCEKSRQKVNVNNYYYVLHYVLSRFLTTST